MSEADSIFRNRPPAAGTTASDATHAGAGELPVPGTDAPREQLFEYAARVGLMHAQGALGTSVPEIVDRARRLYVERWGGADQARGA